MASRFWVGGGSSTNWSATANTNWAATSGGVNNASVPTSADDVFFDANSGAGTAVVDVGFAGSIRSLDCTGFTGTFDLNSRTLTITGGSVVCKFASTHTGPINGTLSFTIAAGATTLLTTAGHAVGFVNMDGTAATGGTLQLQDALTTNSSLLPNGGTFDTNNQTLTIGNAIIHGSGTSRGSVKYGSSSISVAGNYTNLSADTVDAGTSTITLTGPNVTFAGGSKTYYNVTLSGTGIDVITGSNTFNTLTRSGVGRTLNFTAGTTQTVKTFTASGSAGNLVTLQSTTAGTAWTISCNTPSDQVCSFLSIKDSTATGTGVNWFAQSSTNVSGNTGWNFGNYNTKALSSSNAQSSSLSVVANKVLSATQSETASIVKLAKTVLSAAQSQSASLARTISKTILSLQSQTTLLIKSVNKSLLATNGQLVFLVKTFTKPLLATQAQSASLISAMRFGAVLSATVSQVASLSPVRLLARVFKRATTKRIR